MISESPADVHDLRQAVLRRFELNTAWRPFLVASDRAFALTYSAFNLTHYWLSGRVLAKFSRVLNYDFVMSQDLTESETSIEHSGPAGVPTREELSVLSTTESLGFRLVRLMNTGGWKRFWTFCQRHIGSLWIYLATYNLMNVFGVENVEATDADRPLILVANHRSFFDMYTVSSVLFRRTTRPITLFFPVRAKFFYDNPIGWLVNLVMGWWAMYPPFFREQKEAKKRAFDKFSVRELVRICSSGRGHVIGFHPEGKRNLSEDPYSFLPAQPGVGKVIYDARPQVVPVFVTGLINDLPRQIMGNWTSGEKVRIWFGEPIDLSEFYPRRDSVRTHKQIADHLMERIADLGRRDREWIEQQGRDEGTVP